MYLLWKWILSSVVRVGKSFWRFISEPVVWCLHFSGMQIPQGQFLKSLNIYMKFWGMEHLLTYFQWSLQIVEVNLQIHWQSNLIKRIEEELMFLLRSPTFWSKRKLWSYPWNDPAYLATGNILWCVETKRHWSDDEPYQFVHKKKLNNQSAYELFSFLHGQEILEKLKIKEIPADKINMTPLLLKNKEDKRHSAWK